MESAEQWFQEAGILSRWDETNISMHEAQPDAELGYWGGRERWHILTALHKQELIEDTDD